MTPLEAVAGRRANPISTRSCEVNGFSLFDEDDEDLVGGAHRLLERYGCVVETAHAGDEAVVDGPPQRWVTNSFMT